MRILIDTNILFSAILFPRSRVADTLIYITRNHEMFLTDQNITELKEVVRRKCPEHMPAVYALLSELSFTLIPAISSSDDRMRDRKDQPILNAAIMEDLDMILTGDKDFLSLALERPECLSVAEFQERIEHGTFSRG